MRVSDYEKAETSNIDHKVSSVEDKKDFLELKIGDGPSTPYYLVSDGRKEAFIRSGNQSIPAPEHILNNLILKGKQIRNLMEIRISYL